MAHPSLIFLLAWMLGVALQLQQATLWSLGVYAGCLLSAGLLLPLGLVGSARVGSRGLLLGALLAGALAGLGLTGARAAHHAAQAMPHHLQGLDLVVTGRVASLPRRTELGERFDLVVETATRAGQPVPLPERLQLSWYGSAAAAFEEASAGTRQSPGLRAGDRWRFTVRLRSPHGNANPHGFDRERQLWEQSIGATGYVRNGPRDPAPQRLGRTAWHPLDAARQWVSERIDAQVGDPRSAGVLAALVVGDQSAIERADWDLFRTTGVAHLMSISGLHVTMFAWLATALMGVLWRRLARVRPQALLAVPAPLAAGVGGVALATAYALFSGWGVPSQRTVIMLAVVVGLRLSVRRWPWPVVWLLAMVAVLLLDPWALLQPGFWLSFVAVGILFATDPGQPLARAAQAEQEPRARRSLRAAGGLLREQAVVTVALAPLTLLLFGQFSVVGLLANLLAIPWVTLVITPLAMLGLAVPLLWEAAALAVQAQAAVLQWLAQWPWAAIYRAIPPAPLALAGVLGGVLLVLRLPWAVRGAGLLLVWPVLLWAPLRPALGQFELLAMDVGQGSAVLVRTARHTLLYDTGPRYSPESDAGQRVIVPLLRVLGEAPHTVVVSHRDSDHAGGMAAVRSAWPQARWLSSFDAEPAQRCVAGQRWQWDGVDFEVLHPQPAHYGPDGQGLLSSNAMSCVLRVASAQHSAWLGGDIDAEQETRLALAQPDARATVLLAPHHGSLTSSSPVLLNTLRPRWVLVQSGYRNRFNHPAPAVLERYRQRAMRWVTSAECGAATWRSAEPDAVHCQRDVARRYWHHPAPAFAATQRD
ncbi:DNA internalization-related competence protein ComEC/Rec2 [Hydrogenophaga sp.]|uniref:DNA internalization-related competence protein ComEC/Rec2 n=1 Tax=Hydrogenophaga sp. TaxID=1904254 RepID=UPI003F6CC5DE